MHCCEGVKFKSSQVLSPNPHKSSAVDCWKKLTPEQQADAYEMHGLGCSGHSVNLTTDASHNKSEYKVLAENMVRDRAARATYAFA